jgi:chemotaxis protein histidine kinase CheA
MRKAGEQLAKEMAEKLAVEKAVPLKEATRNLPSDRKLAELAKKQGFLSASERKALEKAVAKYAKPNNTLPIPPELGEALAKLAQNKDFQKAAELMQKLAQKLNSGQMSAADKQALQKQLEALAKALKGTDLDKLAKMMRQNAEQLAKMSPEQLQKLVKQMQAMQAMAGMLAKAGEEAGKVDAALRQYGIGSGFSGEDRNTGPRAKIKPVKEIARSPSQVGPSGVVFAAGETKGAPDTASPASVPYTMVLSDYRKAAEHALAKEKVPPAYRTRVKQYFEHLE